MDELRELVPLGDPEVEDLAMVVNACQLPFVKQKLENGEPVTINRRAYTTLEAFAFNITTLPSGNVLLTPWQASGVFSFRAECHYDITTFRSIMAESGFRFHMREEPLTLGEYAAELRTDLTLDEIRNIMRTQEDSHVMIQTLRELPLDQNGLERDRSVEWW